MLRTFTAASILALACAMPLHEALGVPASARASFHCYSLREDVDALVTGLERVREVFAS